MPMPMSGNFPKVCDHVENYSDKIIFPCWAQCLNPCQMNTNWSYVAADINHRINHKYISNGTVGNFSRKKNVQIPIQKQYTNKNSYLFTKLNADVIPYVNWAIAPSPNLSLSFSLYGWLAGRRQHNKICLRRKFKHVQIYNLKSSFSVCSLPRLHISERYTRELAVMSVLVSRLCCSPFSFLQFYIALDRVLCACFFFFICCFLFACFAFFH